MKKQKNYTLDFFRGGILVVFIHVQLLEPFGNWIETVAKCAVPFFFMVSGYFLENGSRSVTEKILKSIKKIG